MFFLIYSILTILLSASLLYFSQKPASPDASQGGPNSPEIISFTSPESIQTIDVGGPLKVPFTSQAPFANWKDPRQQDGCEEAAVLMAMKWVTDKSITSKQAALDEILALSKFQEEKYGSYHDTNAVDTVKRLFNDYYYYQLVAVKTVASAQDIISELESGNLVITPMNGQALKNPHFTPPGPERHNIIVKGFTQTEFITNDPGIAQGENYRYPKDLFFSAIRDYPTGDHVPITGVEKNMIVITKN